MHFRCINWQASQRHKEFSQVQATRRLTALLLHVWIEWYIMVLPYNDGCGCEPGRCRLQVEDEQILTQRRSPLA